MGSIRYAEQLQLNFFRLHCSSHRSGSFHTENSQKDVLAPSEEAEMFQPTELKSIVSVSKLWDWETVLMPAAYLQTLYTNMMPCF